MSKKHQVVQNVAPSRELMLANQVSILNSMGFLMVNVLGATRPDESSSIPGTRTDGGARMAAENTLANICDRMDKLIADESRWSQEYQTKLEEEHMRLMSAQIDMVRSQEAAANMLRTPSYRFRPTLCKLIDGGWAAILGDINDIGNAIVGQGFTPELALKDFDSVFSTVTLSPAFMAWATEREADFEAGKTPKPYEKKLETERSGNAGENDGSRKDARRSRRGHWPKSRSGDAQSPGSGTAGAGGNDSVGGT
jgi:hypothetical protein